MTKLAQLQSRVVACRRCPRLVRYLDGIRREYPDYWCRPVPSFGDPSARLLLVGLAPGRSGSNRTGRMFTGDASGSFLYRALHTLRWANQPEAWGQDDGLRLRDVCITAVVRCAPPQNKPLPAEIRRCAPFVGEELRLLRRVRVVVTLGEIAHRTYLTLRGLRPRRLPIQAWDCLSAASGAGASRGVVPSESAEHQHRRVDDADVPGDVPHRRAFGRLACWRMTIGYQSSAISYQPRLLTGSLAES